tara:strand:+ start:466 stop:588 length:123 start_codon:yes stop_codon:yes gene_type:complete
MRIEKYANIVPTTVTNGNILFLEIKFSVLVLNKKELSNAT